jgi:hypothetical protein
MEEARVRDFLRKTLEYVESFVVIVLVLAGIAGISYNMFRDKGWAEAIVGHVWELHLDYPAVAFPVTIGAIVIGILWRNQNVARGRVSQLPDVFIYLLMALGAYFIGYFVIHGRL